MTVVFTGGKRLMQGCAAAGVLGLLFTFAGLARSSDPKRLYAAYLVAFVYWVGLGLGALLLNATMHASNTHWTVVLRRIKEALSFPLLVLAPLAVPVVVGMKHLYLWVEPEARGLPEHVLDLIHHKHAYLNVPGFVGRLVFYFLSWSAVTGVLHRWSKQQDAQPADATLAKKARTFSSATLPLLALTLTFAATDWMMTLEPTWFSTLFGGYYFAGAFLSAIAAVTLVALAGRTTFLLGALSPEHLHNLGKLLLAFVCFWAYLAFSQYLLIWIANIPEEVTWYRARTRTGWQPVAVFLAVFHFIVPFFVLLSARLKRAPKLLAATAAGCLVVHFVDLHWLIVPSLYENGPSLHWADLTAFVGIGGVFGATAVWAFRGRPPYPVGDPNLATSLRYVQP